MEWWWSPLRLSLLPLVVALLAVSLWRPGSLHSQYLRVLSCSTGGPLPDETSLQFLLQRQAKQSPSALPVISWQPDADFIQELHLLRIPVVLKNTIVETWQARHHWTPSYLSQRKDSKGQELTLLHARNGSDPLFIGAIMKPDFMEPALLRPLVVEKGFMYRSDSINISDFLFHEKSTNEYHFYTGPLYYFEPALQLDVEPLHLLTLDKQLSVPNVWMGHAGVKVQCHYDRSYNLVVQLYGHSRWTLHPPKDALQLGLFPSIHPSYHHSQLVDEDLLNTTDYEVEVGPGDLLYIPPYWFYSIELVDTSIAVTVVSPSEEEVLWSHLNTPLPFDTQRFDRKKRVVVARTLITLLFSISGGKAQHVYAPPLLQDLVSNVLLGNRYRRLKHNLRPLHDQVLEAELQETQCFRKGKSGQDEPALDRVEWLTLVMLADEKNSILQRVSRFGEGLADTFLADYVEQLIWWAVGWRDVTAVLQHCFV